MVRDPEVVNYLYDPTGNLTNRSRPQGPLQQNFRANSLNQITNATRSGTLMVAGWTTGSPTNVTVNTSNATIWSDFTFSKGEFTLADGTNTFTAIARDNLGRSDTNILITYLPASINFQYDLNGNLLFDGSRAFSYDDENQLISVVVTNVFRTEFTFHGKMRRRIRREYAWQLGDWRLTNEVRYVYDGNLVIQERDGLNLPRLSYTRGIDLSGTIEGAGGIGGLLAFSQLSTTSPQRYYYHADGNGNVTMLINSLQLPAAKYLYTAFGYALFMSGPLAEANTYRFSSKEYHTSSGLYYYGRRFYEPNLQRWVNRDPLGEARSLNLFRFVRNNAIAFIDALGNSEKDVQTLIAETKAATQDLTKRKLRITPWLNNLFSVFQTIAGADDPYYGCGEQADFVSSILAAENEIGDLHLDDTWIVTQTQVAMVPSITHQFLVAKSSNEADPLIIIDPHQNKFQIITNPSDLKPWNVIWLLRATNVKLWPDGIVEKSPTVIFY